MNTRQSPITTPKMIVSRLLRKLILFTRLLIKGNLLVKSFSLVWTALEKDSLRKKSNLLKKWPPLKPLFGLQGSPWCPKQCLFVHQSSVQSFWKEYFFMNAVVNWSANLRPTGRSSRTYSGISLVLAILHLTILTKVWLDWIFLPHEES